MDENDAHIHDDIDAFREQHAREHAERLTGYRGMLARIESAMGEAQLNADEASGTPNTTSQFTDDLRFLIALSEEIVNKFRPHPEGEHPFPSPEQSHRDNT